MPDAALVHPLDLLLADDGYICLADHPELKGAVQWQRRQGRLAPLLPGIWIPTDPPDPPLPTLLRALSTFDRDAVVSGWAAGWLLLEQPQVNAAIPVASMSQDQLVRHRSGRRYAFGRARVPERLVMSFGGVRCTNPSTTAVDLAATDGGAAIDASLRLRVATLDSLQLVLDATPGRRGNEMRRRVLADSRDEPWSAAERLAHRLLRKAGIRGWVANQPIRLQDRQVFGDIVFRAQRVLVEIDGWAHHGSPSAFQADRVRQNQLVNAGWRVLRFTWQDLTERSKEFIATVRAGLHH